MREPLGQLVEVDVAVRVLVDDDDVGDRLPPGELVGVVFVGPEEHHRPLRGRDRLGEPVAGGQPGREAQLQDGDQLVHRRRRPGAAEDHQVVVGAADGVADQSSGLLAQPGGLQPGAGALGVGVGVAGQDVVADEVLDEVERTARSGVVGVGDPPPAVRAVQRRAFTDHTPPDPVEQR